MKRYHDEKKLIENRAKLRQHLDSVAGIRPEFFPPKGSFRKSRRCLGCGRSRCQLCHPDKYPKRIPTRQEKQTWRDEE